MVMMVMMMMMMTNSPLSIFSILSRFIDNIKLNKLALSHLFKQLKLVKLLFRFLLIVFLLSTQNSAFAFVFKNSDNALVSDIIRKDMPQTAITKAPKPSFLERYMSKMMTKKGLKAHILEKKEAITSGDRLANIGFKMAVIGVAVRMLLLLRTALFLSFLGSILGLLATVVILAGGVICIVAIKNKDITPKGKKKAKAGIWIFGVVLLLYITFIIAISFSAG